jgi:hypothetical protein
MKRAKERAAKAAAAAAKAAAAARAAASAWHKGYGYPVSTDNGAVFWKWVNKPACTNAIYGCEEIDVKTANGCSSLFAESNVRASRNGAIIGNTIATQDNIPPHAAVLMELDDDTGTAHWWDPPKMTCYP